MIWFTDLLHDILKCRTMEAKRLEHVKKGWENIEQVILTAKMQGAFHTRYPACSTHGGSAAWLRLREAAECIGLSPRCPKTPWAPSLSTQPCRPSSFHPATEPFKTVLKASLDRLWTRRIVKEIVWEWETNPPGQLGKSLPWKGQENLAAPACRRSTSNLTHVSKWFWNEVWNVITQWLKKSKKKKGTLKGNLRRLKMVIYFDHKLNHRKCFEHCFD